MPVKPQAKRTAPMFKPFWATMKDEDEARSLICAVDRSLVDCIQLLREVFFSALRLDVTDADSWDANILLTSSTGLRSRAGEGSSHKTACSVPQVCQVLDLPGPSDGAGGEPGCSALV